MTALFISDLHLTAGDAETTRRFLKFMAGPARTAQELYILGDLFEAWIGDDDDDQRLTPILAALRSLTDAGISCALMHGNRRRSDQFNRSRHLPAHTRAAANDGC